MVRVKNAKRMYLFLCFSFLVFLLLGHTKTLSIENADSCQYTSEIYWEQADSLLRLGQKEEALELYSKALELSEPLSSLQFPYFKEIGEVYLKAHQYRKAIEFFQKYEWMATQQVIAGRGYMPDDGAEWWGLSDENTDSLEKELRTFGAYLDELEVKYSVQKSQKVEGVARSYIENVISKSYSLNFAMWSDSIKEGYRVSGNIDPLRMEKLFNGWYPDSIKIDSIDELSTSRGKVYVKEFGTKIINDSARKPFMEIGIYHFVKTATGWKFNGFEY